ncbi:intermembrane phospholipid transport protein YdbH family protein [Microbulbifer taiwanensis]|uniref:YdbH domain-containing protein n=1 Tax=Microbulbifer taiwanensis TaxID=986746 RepID=A0ABW1YTC5_9GAMM|nr:YdbH domain-containing protein [Microbulbifer taiwanensis]
MQKTRLITVTAALLAVAAGCWAWWERDRVAPKLINALLQGSRIEELRGLELGPGVIAAKRLVLAIESGAHLQLDNVQLLRPFSLLFASQQNRAELAVAKLSYASGVARNREPQAPNETQGLDTAGVELSESIKLLKYLPETIQIGNLAWQGQTAQLNLRRDYGEDTIHAELSSGGKLLSLQLRPQVNQLQFTVQLAEGKQSPALSVHGNLVQKETGQWQATAQLESELQRVTGLPLSVELNKIAASASGKLTANIEVQLPDQFLQLQDYTGITAKIQSESVLLVLPEALLGAAAELSLSTRSPLVIKLDSMQPLRPEQISGSGSFALTPGKQQQPLIQAEFDTGTTEGRPSFTIAGHFNLESASPLLESPHWQQKLKSLSMDSAAGRIEFHGEARLKQFGEIGSSDLGGLSDIKLSLLAGSKASVNIAAAKEKDSLATQIGWRRGKVSVQLPKALTIGADQWPGNIRITGETVALRAEEKSDGLSLDSQLRSIECNFAQEVDCSLTLNASAPQLSMEAHNLIVEKPTISTQLKLLRDGDHQRLQLRQLAFSAEEIGGGAVEFELLSLNSPQLECTIMRGTTECTSTVLTNSFSTMGAAELEASGSIRMSAFRFKQENGQLLLSTSYRSDDLRLQAQGGYRLDAELKGQLGLDGDTLSGESEVRAGAMQLQSRWKHNLGTSQGQADITLAETTFSQQKPLSQSVKGLPLDIVAGTLSASGQLSWPPTQQDRVDLRFDEVAAVFGESFAAGARGQLSLRRQGEHWVSGEPQAIRLDTLDPGLPIRNIRFSLALDQNRDLTLGNISAELLGGRLQSQSLVWNLAGEERNSQVSISEVSLRELAREMEAENFAATGILDLQIPLVTGPKGVTVKRGGVKARPPGGRLRYYGAFSAAMLAGNPQLKLLAGALEDYNYRELSGTLEYPPSGDMQLQLKLVGRSASVAADRDLIINLNLENNIPDMLRSLQATRDLTEALEKQVQ